MLRASPGESEAPQDCCTMGWTHFRQSFEVELAELLRALRVKGTEEILLDALLKRKTLRLNHQYRCVCGRATLLLPLCLDCSKL